MDSRKIQFVIIGILATFVALYLGISAATAQMETVLWVLGSASFIACISLGRRIWLLIPFMTSLGIGMRMPGNPDSALLGQLLVLGFSVPLFLMRKLPFGLAWTEMEFWCMVLTLFVMQAYMRHPVGLLALGGDTVGARPYANYVIFLITGLLLGGLKVPVGDLKWFLRLTILGGLMNLAVSILGSFVPVIAYATGASYANPDKPSYEEYGTVADTGAATRIGYLGGLGKNLMLWISCYISPLRACFRPLWGVLILLAIVSAMMSGFRNNIIGVGLIFLIGTAYRSGLAGISFSIFGSVCGVALLAFVNLMTPLPPNIQRSLTFLPGTWEERYRRDAAESSEWRFEVWKEVLLTDRWIDNKWLGDGLGLKASELFAQVNMRKGTRMGTSGFDAHRENILKTGDYHSGPVQTIRTIGYIGLIFMLIAQLRLAVYAHRQIQRCRNTEWFPLALLVGIPTIIAPIYFLFVFGTFIGGASAFFMSYGTIRLLERNLPLPAYVIGKRQSYVLRTRQRINEVAVAER